MAAPATRSAMPSTSRSSTPRRSAGRRQRKARDMADPVELPPGDYAVVLEPYAVVDIVDMLGYLGFSALAVQEERSFFEPGRAHRLAARDADRRRLGPVGHAGLVRLRRRADATRDAPRGRGLPRGRPRRPDRGAGRRRLDRPRPPGAEPLGPVPAPHGHGRRARPLATSSSAGSSAACSSRASTTRTPSTPSRRSSRA